MQIDIFAGAFQINWPFAFNDRRDVDRAFHQGSASMFQGIEIMDDTQIVRPGFANDAVMGVVEVCLVETDVIAWFQSSEIGDLLLACFLERFLPVRENLHHL